METLAISKFKTYALKIIAEVAESKKSIIITKRGNPLVKIVPFKDINKKNKSGKLADTIIFEEDIVSPLGEKQWEVCN